MHSDDTVLVKLKKQLVTFFLEPPPKSQSSPHFRHAINDAISCVMSPLQVVSWRQWGEVLFLLIIFEYRIWEGVSVTLLSNLPKN